MRSLIQASAPRQLPVLEASIVVSGLEMHRDPGGNRCQALPFGSHENNSNWLEWATVRDEIKIVGATFSNRGI